MANKTEGPTSIEQYLADVLREDHWTCKSERWHFRRQHYFADVPEREKIQRAKQPSLKAQLKEAQAQIAVLSAQLESITLDARYF